MQINYNLFGFIRTTHEMANRYLLLISSEIRGSDDVLKGLYESRDYAATYWGARFKAWRLARLYAQIDGRSQAIWILKEFKGRYYVKWQGEIPVRVVVGFFTRRF